MNTYDITTKRRSPAGTAEGTRERRTAIRRVALIRAEGSRFDLRPVRAAVDARRRLDGGSH